MKAALDTLSPGTLIGGKFRVERTIGAGGLSAVVAATEEKLKRKVAVKIVHSSTSGDPEVAARFERQVQLADALDHDNICRVIDVGALDDGRPYVVTPFLEGRSLKQIIEEEGAPLETERVTNLLCQALAALSAAHEKGILHLCFKPSALFVIEAGGWGEVVKVLDFGVSEIIESNVVRNPKSGGAVVGTPYYLAPEQARGTKGVDHRADIYAAGVILYEALTGKRPFGGDSPSAVLYKIMAEPFAAPSRIEPKIPAGLEAVILKAMAKDPAARFSSASKMREACEEAAEMSNPERYTTRPTAVTDDDDMPFAPTFVPPEMQAGAADAPRPAETASPPTPPARAPRFSAGIKWVLVALLFAGLAVLGALIAALFLRTGDQPAAVPVTRPVGVLPPPTSVPLTSGEHGPSPTPDATITSPEPEPAPKKVKALGPKSKPARETTTKDGLKIPELSDPPEPPESADKKEAPPLPEKPPTPIDKEETKKIEGREGTFIIDDE
jgi:serine/threonine protein kinase